jgi:hypothetical protein
MRSEKVQIKVRLMSRKCTKESTLINYNLSKHNTVQYIRKPQETEEYPNDDTWSIFRKSI